MKSPQIFTLLLALALVGAGGASAQEKTARKATPPPAAPIKPVAFPAYAERTLANGAQLIVVENHEQPVVTVSLRIKSGGADDPEGKVGVASFTAALLNKGTTTRDARQIAESIEFVGGSLFAGSSDEATSVNATVLTEYLDTALVLLSDVLQNPTFPANELDIERRRSLSALQVSLSQPATLASRQFTRELYGAHPYGRLLTREALQAIQREDLVQFHHTHYKPGNALVVVAGDVKPDDIAARLNRHFSAWTGAAPARSPRAQPPQRQQREIVMVHKPGAVQASFRIGHLAEPATHPDWIALDLGLQVLGGGSTGWLYKVLREQKGYTYGAGAGSAKQVERSHIQASADVRNEVADSALTELLGLIDQLRNGTIPAEDLKLAQDFVTGSFPLTIETPQQVAGQVASTRLLGLPRSYLETYRQKVAALKVADVQRAVRAHLDASKAVVVVVGDATVLKDGLAPFGTVRVVDADGKPVELAAAAPPVATVASAPDGAAIRPTTLVYGMSFQGNPLGDITWAVTREPVEGKEAVKVLATATSGFLNIKHEMALDGKTLAPIYSRAQEQTGPMSFSFDLRAQGGKIVGKITPPNQPAKDISVDAAPGTLLPGMDAFVIWLADLEKTKEFAIASFSARTAEVRTLRVQVKGETKITVGAGEFDAYELEVTGGETDLRLFARKAAPHIILKHEFMAQPVVMELKSLL